MWVLLVFLGWSSAGNGLTVEYSTREGCLAAIEHLERSKAANRIQAAVCIPKD